MIVYDRLEGWLCVMASAYLKDNFVIVRAIDGSQHEDLYSSRRAAAEALEELFRACVNGCKCWKLSTEAPDDTLDDVYGEGGPCTH